MEAGLDHVSQLFVATFEGLPNSGPPAVEEQDHKVHSELIGLCERKYVFYHDAGRKPLQRTPVASLQISLSKTDQHVNACG